MRYQKTSLNSGLIYGLLSFQFVVFGGLSANLCIFILGSEALGVFNQTFAIYILVSQFSVFGIHHSVMRATAASQEFRDQMDLLAAGIILVSLISSFLPCCLIFCRSVCGGGAGKSSCWGKFQSFSAQSCFVRSQQNSSRLAQWTNANALFLSGNRYSIFCLGCFRRSYLFVFPRAAVAAAILWANWWCLFQFCQF